MTPVAPRKQIRPGARSAITLALAVVTLAGCASAPERFYTLSSTCAPSRDAARAGEVDRPGPTVVVAPAAVPDLVDRPQLVTFTGDTRVVILEQQRWAEPLRTAIARVVAEGLGGELGPARVSTRDEALRRPDCRVYLDVRRFDARRDSAAAVVDLEALWTVTCAASSTRSGRSVAREPIRGPTTEAAVVAQGRALHTITRDVGRALSDAAPVAALPRAP